MDHLPGRVALLLWLSLSSLDGRQDAMRAGIVKGREEKDVI